jgi:hypothetical protein
MKKKAECRKQAVVRFASGDPSGKNHPWFSKAECSRELAVDRTERSKTIGNSKYKVKSTK